MQKIRGSNGAVLEKSVVSKYVFSLICGQISIFVRMKAFDDINYAHIDREHQGARVDATFGPLATMVEEC